MPEIRFVLAPRSLAMLVATGLALWAIIAMPGILALAFLALMLTATLAPVVDHLATRAPRPVAVLAVFAALAGLLALLLLLAAPVVLEQAQALARSLPAYGETWRQTMDRLTALNARWGMVPPPSRLGEQAAVWLSQRLSEGLQATVSLTVHVVTAVASGGLVLLGSVYMLLQAPELRQGFLSLVPVQHRPLVEAQWPQLAQRLGAYVRGQLLSMSALASMLALGLSLIGLPYAWLIAVVAGLADLIPMLGTITGVTLSALVALTVDWHLVPPVLLVFAVANFLQGNVLGPLIFARTVEVPPVLTLLALLVGAQLLGLMGALLAIPVTSLVVLLVENLWVPVAARSPRSARGGRRPSCGSGRRAPRP